MFFWVFPRRQFVVDAGEIPKRTFSVFKSRRKSEIKNAIRYFNFKTDGV